MRLLSKDYSSSALELAPKFLGMTLCRRISDNEVIRLKITETEAYYGESDTACHAHKGRTPRTKILYEAGGVSYVYLCYGIHHLFNVVTGPKEFPQAVLIRGVEGFSGPGRLTKALKIDKQFNGENLVTSNRLWIEDENLKVEYEQTKRIGIDYASDEYKNKLWRFVLKS